MPGESFLTYIISNCSFDQESVFSFQHTVIVLQPNHLRSVCAVHDCLPTVGYLLAAKSWLFIFLSQKKNNKGPVCSEGVNQHQLVKQGQVVPRTYVCCIYMSSEESLSETAVSERHEGNSSGSDEDISNKENLCVRPLSWQSMEVNGLMAQLDRKVAWCQRQ